MSPEERKSNYLIIGGTSGFILGILGNLIASYIQQDLLENSFSPIRIFLIILCSFLGVIVMALIETKNKSVKTQRKESGKHKYNIYTNIKLLWSKLRTRGKNIHMDDISAIGSDIDIDTK